MDKHRIRVAIIDDEEITAMRLQEHLAGQGFSADFFLDGESFMESFRFSPYEVVVTDMKLPGMSGLEILTEVKTRFRAAEVVVITGYATVDSAIEAIKAGAFHYLTKPIRLDEFDNLISRVMEKILLKSEMKALRALTEQKAGRDGMIGASPEMDHVVSLVEKVAPLTCPVIIQGQSGTGKELVARAIHRLSNRRDHPIVTLNCGGFSPDLIANELFGHEKSAFTGAARARAGLLESADRGTVFLDEIADMPSDMQVKLLRVLQEGQILRLGATRPTDIDIRIIAASNRDLVDEVKAGRFREDLFFRLNVMTIAVPRLTDRQGDVLLLADHFLRKLAGTYKKEIKGFSSRARKALERYDYPGNVRELENIIARTIALAEGSLIHLADLPPHLVKAYGDPIAPETDFPCLEEAEKDLIEKVLKSVDGQRGKASAILGITRTTLWRKMKKFNLEI